MKNLLKAAAFFILLFFAFHTYGQKSFPASYVSNTGDTVQGEVVNYSQWRNNPSTIEFLEAGSATPRLFTPQDINKLVINGFDEYVSFSGKRLFNSINDYELINGKGISSLADTTEDIFVFLRLVFRSPAYELYVLSDEKRLNFFGKRSGEELIELKYKKYYNGQRVIETPVYRDQLANLFNEEIQAQNLFSSLGSLSYREISMEKFFGKLFPGQKKEKSTMQPRAGFVIMAGASLNSLEVKADKLFDVITRSYKSSVSPVLTIGYVFPLRRNFGRYFIQPQVKLFKYKNSGSMTNENSTKTTTFQSDLIISPELNFGLNLINKENMRWYLSGGIGYLFFQNHRQENHSVYIYGNVRDEEIDLVSTSYSINFSTGVTLSNRFVASATYQVPVTLAQFSNYSPRLSPLQIGVGYKF